MSAEFKWFVAEAIFEATIQGRDESWEPLVEELLFLVRDVDEHSAAARAESIAKAKEHSYENPKGELVTWRLVGVTELTEVIDQLLQDGAEIKSWMSGGEIKSNS